MKITRLKKGNAQFPGLKDPGDIVVCANLEIFVWTGELWMLLGGRFLEGKYVKAFLSYIEDGWPDTQTLKIDIRNLSRASNLEEFNSKLANTRPLPAPLPGQREIDFLQLFLEKALEACCSIERHLLKKDQE